MHHWTTRVMEVGSQTLQSCRRSYSRVHLTNEQSQSMLQHHPRHETSLHSHFVDDHGFSRTRAAGNGNPVKLSTGKLYIYECNEQKEVRQKKKPGDAENALIWVPTTRFETANPSKRTRTMTPIVCPSLIFSTDPVCDEPPLPNAGESLSDTARSSALEPRSLVGRNITRFGLRPITFVRPCVSRDCLNE